ncbi:MAG: AAA family ATPase [Cyanobacteria bacterium P01_F01_bin.150]
MSHSSNPDPSIQLNNDESLRILSRALTLGQGRFSLMLARCDYRHLQQTMVEQLQQLCTFNIHCLTLPESAETLYSSIVETLGDDHPAALMVFGLEQVQDLATVLNTTNQVREEFRKNFDFPVVLWVDSTVQQALIRSAPDFESWSTTVMFESQSEDVRRFLTTETDRIFDTLLEVGAGLFLDNRALQLHSDSPLLAELERGQGLLGERKFDCDPLLNGSVEFVLGRAKVADEAASKAHYDRSIELLDTNDAPEAQVRLGCVWHHLGVWWRTYSVQHRDQYHESCVQARDCFQQAIEIFESAQREDLVARFTEKLGEVLQRMQDWEGLEQLVQKRLTLHDSYPDLFRQSRTYGFRAEIALAKAKRLAKPAKDGKELSKAKAEANAKTIQDTLTQAKAWAEQALQLLQDASKTETIPSVVERETFLDWHNCFLKGWYCFALGRAYKGLGSTDQAIQTLEMAQAEVKESYDPPLYINILEALRELYFDQEDYLKAFDTRQAYRSIQQQYGYRAFVGAGRLQAKKAITNPSLAHVETVGQVSTEIARSGRQQDVERLIGRLQRSDQKLIVLHGQSGVGKSSIIQAGLIPALTPLTFEGREVVVVLQQVYTPWDKRLGDRLLETLRRLEHRATDEALESSQAILQKIEQTVNQNFMAVLILDQFEEFFFVYKDPTDRKLFYQFLKDCLAIPYVKVVLSLREDYLHYLLECNDRLVTLNIINNNILDKDILYYLGNFSPDDAKSVIEGLTQQSQFSLEANLVDALVEDLAQELGEVRPIELQVVGAQLQTEQITNLALYQERGPKNELVSRFLDEVIQDCGHDEADQNLARLVLYLLTDENNTRPLKTRSDIELELNVPEKLDMILAILVKSGLVFRIPSQPEDRFQLVHDYLVIFVRQTQSAQLLSELEKEREQRQITEKKLQAARDRELKVARRATVTLTGLVAAVTAFAMIASLAFLNTFISSQNNAANGKQQLERLLTVLGASKSLRRFPGVIPEIRWQTLSGINQATNEVQIINKFEAHTDKIRNIIFSLDNNFIVSASKDKTIKIWERDGSLVKELTTNDEPTTIAISRDNKKLIIGYESGLIEIYQISDESRIATLNKHTESITDIKLSPNGNQFAISSSDKSISIWDWDGNLYHHLIGHNTSIGGVQFSSDGNQLVSYALHDFVKIWDLSSSEEKYSISVYNTIHAEFSTDNQYLYLMSKDAKVRLYSLSSHLDGVLLSTRAAPSRYGEPELNYAFKVKQKEIFFTRGHDELAIGYNSERNIIKVPYFSPIASSDDGQLIAITNNNIISIIETDTFLAQDKTYSYYNNGQPFYFNSIGKYFLRPNREDVAIQSISGDEFRGKNILTHKSIIGLYKDNVLGDDIIATHDLSTVLKIWTTGNGDNDKKIETNSLLSHYDLSSSGNLIVTGNQNGMIDLWDTEGNMIQSLGLHNADISSLYFSPNDSIVVSRDKDLIKFWISESGLAFQELNRLSAKEKWSNIYFSPDDKFLITHDTRGIVSLRNQDGSIIKILSSDLERIEDIQFSPNGDIITAFSRDRNYGGKWTVVFWDINGNQKRIMEDFGTNFYGRNQVIFSGSKNLFIRDESSPGLKKISLEDSSNDFLVSHPGGIVSQIEPGGKNKEILTTTKADNTIRLWSNDGKKMHEFNEHKHLITDLNFSENGLFFVSVDEKGIIKIWDYKKEDSQVTIESESLDIKKDDTYHYSIHFSGQEFRVYGPENVSIFNILGEKLYSFPANDFSRISKNNKTVLLNQSDKVVYLLNEQGKIISQLKGHDDIVNSISSSLNGSYLATASNDKTVKIWNRNGELVKSILHDNPVLSVTINPRTGTIVTASGENIRFFDKSGKELLKNGNLITLKGHTSQVNSILFSPNGRFLASASYESIRLWDVKDWSEIDEFKIGYGAYRTSGNDELSFSADSSVLAYGSAKVYVRLLNQSLFKGLWFKEASFYPLTELPENGIPESKHWLTVQGKKGKLVLSLGVEHEMQQACAWINGHLETLSRIENDSEARSKSRLCNGFLKID